MSNLVEPSVTKTISKYIYASPPMLALKCTDGIFCLAIHIPDETLSDNVGPRRIEQIDTASLLLSSGWRTDGMQLADKARELCLEDTSIFGTFSTSFSRRNEDYARRLANGLVEYLVDCSVKDNLRTLVTVGLLATVSGTSDMNKDEIQLNHTKKCQLNFIDVTGVYPCRALALGLCSDQINQRLMTEDLDSWSVNDAREKTFQILRDEFSDERKEGDNATIVEGQKKRKISNMAIVETVILSDVGIIQRCTVPYSDISRSVLTTDSILEQEE